MLLFVHEMGHVLEAKRQGLPVSAPFFIPFLGAAIQMKRMPQSAWHEALNGIAGPILGTAGAAVIWARRRTTTRAARRARVPRLPDQPLQPHPVPAARRRTHRGGDPPGIVALGLVALVGLVIVQPNPILILILIVGGMETWRRCRCAHHPESQEYYRVKPWQRIAIAVLYFGLAAFLVFAMELTHVPRDF